LTVTHQGYLLEDACYHYALVFDSKWTLIRWECSGDHAAITLHVAPATGSAANTQVLAELHDTVIV
jgi:hypothetical protein